MKTVSIEIEIPDDAELGPGIVITYLQPPSSLHASFRCDAPDPIHRDLMRWVCAGALGIKMPRPDGM